MFIETTSSVTGSIPNVRTWTYTPGADDGGCRHTLIERHGYPA